MYVKTNGGAVNVRAGQGLSARIIGSLPNGTHVVTDGDVLHKVDGYFWQRIISPMDGWVAYTYLSFNPPRSIVVDSALPNVG